MVGGGEVKEVKEVNEVKDRNPRYGPVKNYTDLLVYKQAYRLALDISKFAKIPREEQFELGRQLRRCARSVPANITEGWTKRNFSSRRVKPPRVNSGLTLLRTRVLQRVLQRIDC